MELQPKTRINKHESLLKVLANYPVGGYTIPGGGSKKGRSFTITYVLAMELTPKLKGCSKIAVKFRQCSSSLSELIARHNLGNTIMSEQADSVQTSMHSRRI